MRKKNKTLIVLLVILGILAIVIASQLIPFTISGNERMTREFYQGTEVEPGQAVQEHYQPMYTSGDWAATVEEWINCTEGTQITKKYFLYQSGNTVYGEYQTIQMPNEYNITCEDCSNYEFGNKGVYTTKSSDDDANSGCVMLKTKGKKCASGMDEDDNRIVSFAELWNAANDWLSTTPTINRQILGEAIMDWAQGCGNW